MSALLKQKLNERREHLAQVRQQALTQAANVKRDSQIQIENLYAQANVCHGGILEIDETLRLMDEPQPDVPEQPCEEVGERPEEDGDADAEPAG